jgi:formate-dependent nitrite reductase membrane component NrfD
MNYSLIILFGLAGCALAVLATVFLNMYTRLSPVEKRIYIVIIVAILAVIGVLLLKLFGTS